MMSGVEPRPVSRSVYRRDRKNVGDWWSLPARYFPLRAARDYDLARPDTIPNEPGVCVVGGGGLGRPEFVPFLEHLIRPDRRYSLIAWGVGADSKTDRSGTVARSDDTAELCAYFRGFDAVGTRVWSEAGYEDPVFRWVPCASAMHPLFCELAGTRPVERVGVYEHLRVPLAPALGARKPPLGLKRLARSGYPTLSNRGTNLEAKLRFLARFEFVVTNSYHGVFWATLLGRKVVCHPFKNGLYSFRHAPAYLGEAGLEAAMDGAVAYPEAHDECRMANLSFYRELLDRFGDF